MDSGQNLLAYAAVAPPGDLQVKIPDAALQQFIHNAFGVSERRGRDDRVHRNARLRDNLVDGADQFNVHGYFFAGLLFAHFRFVPQVIPVGFRHGDVASALRKTVALDDCVVRDLLLIHIQQLCRPV